MSEAVESRGRISHTVQDHTIPAGFEINRNRQRGMAICDCRENNSRYTSDSSILQRDRNLTLATRMDRAKTLQIPVSCMKCSRGVFIGEEEEVFIELRRKNQTPLFVHDSCFSCYNCGSRIQGKYGARLQDNGEFWCDYCNDQADQQSSSGKFDEEQPEEFATVILIGGTRKEEDEFATMRLLQHSLTNKVK